jgi:hypothetical protein
MKTGNELDLTSAPLDDFMETENVLFIIAAQPHHNSALKSLVFFSISLTRLLQALFSEHAIYCDAFVYEGEEISLCMILKQISCTYLFSRVAIYEIFFDSKKIEKKLLTDELD